MGRGWRYDSVDGRPCCICMKSRVQISRHMGVKLWCYKEVKTIKSLGLEGYQLISRLSERPWFTGTWHKVMKQDIQRPLVVYACKGVHVPAHTCMHASYTRKKGENRNKCIKEGSSMPVMCN